MKSVLAALLAGLAVTAQAAATADPQEGLTWLKKMASASRQLNYTGTFVYYRNTRQHETSRIAHFVNPAGGEIERMETLDGPPREVMRTNDQVTCYLPATRTVLIEKRSTRPFPALVPEQLTGVPESYTVRKEGTDRVAGHECQIIVLDPRDKLRYGHQFCAEATSGLPLRARSINEKGEPVESFVFTQLAIGGNFNRDLVKSRYASKSRDWKVDRSVLSEEPANSGWVLANRLPGFKKLAEFKRSIAGRSTTVAHLVFSDGLAAISVFIEPLPSPRVAPSLTHQGAVNIYTKPTSEYMVTALGEVPEATVVQIANSLELKGATAAVK